MFAHYAVGVTSFTKWTSLPKATSFVRKGNHPLCALPTRRANITPCLQGISTHRKVCISSAKHISNLLCPQSKYIDAMPRIASPALRVQMRTECEAFTLTFRKNPKKAHKQALFSQKRLRTPRNQGALFMHFSQSFCHFVRDFCNHTILTGRVLCVNIVLRGDKSPKSSQKFIKGKFIKERTFAHKKYGT